MNHRSTRSHTSALLRAHSAKARRAHIAPTRLVRALAACSLLSFWTGAAELRAQVLPAGMNAVAGQVTSRTAGGMLTVTNSPNAIIKWDSFSIGAQNAVRFEQVNAASQVLNRVTGNDPSAILGSLSSNGRVWLLNPNGVLYGQGARVDVAGLVTSTLNLNDGDWLAGRFRFTQGNSAAGSIVNQGRLSSSLGGRIALLGGTIRNEGAIDAPGGQVVLATGSSIELLDSMTPNVSVKLNAAPGSVVNLGRLSAAGGRIDIQAGSVNQDGIVRADSLERGPGGVVVLRASDKLSLGAASVTSANGDSGGRVTLDGAHNMIRGEVSALGASGSGGQIKLLGGQVGLLDAARVDASGSGGGGEVLVGGGAQGKDPTVPNAQAVYFGPQASIAADALTAGDGGRIILWSDQATRAFGRLSAGGGEFGGDGGFIETSGGWLDARPTRVDLSAKRGRSGTWLLDPFDILITDETSDLNFDQNYTATGVPSRISTGTLNSALGLGVDVVVSTGTGGSQAGNITVSGATIQADNDGDSGASLTLIADRDITMSVSSIKWAFSALPVTFRAGRSGTGAITIGLSTIDSGGGNITLGGFTTYSRPLGGTFEAATGHSGSQAGVAITNFSRINAGVGDLTINGGGGVDGPSRAGVLLTFSGSVTTENYVELQAKSIRINGNSSAAGTPISGVHIEGAKLQATDLIEVFGVGADRGANIQGGSLTVGPSASGKLRIFGSSRDGNGVRAIGPDILLAVLGGASIEIDGITGTAGVAGLGIEGVFPGRTIDATSSTGSVSIGTTQSSNATTLINATIAAQSGAVSLGGVNTLRLENAHVTSSGPVVIRSDSVKLNSGSTLISRAAGLNALRLTGYDPSSSMLLFLNGSGAQALQAPNGRWLVYGTNPQDTLNFDAGGLPYAFKRYGAGSASALTAAESGNGLIFSTPQVATVSGTVLARDYDGTRGATVTNLTAVGVPGDLVALEPTVWLFDDKNAGFNKSVSPSGLSVTFQDSLGKPVYGYTAVSALTGDILKKGLTATATGVDKIYDTNTSASVLTAVTGGLVGNETVVLTGSARFLDPLVGNAKPLSVSFSLTDGSNGGLASNYKYEPAPNVFASITQAQIVISGLSANDKVYDTLIAATLSGTPELSGPGSDGLRVTGSAVASFSDTKVGLNKSVTVSGFGLSGPGAGNYSLVQPVGLHADITRAPIVVSGLSTSNKVYDTTAAATLAGTASVTPLGSDSLTLLTGSAVASFSDRFVGQGKSVAVSGFGLSGADAENYSLVQPSGLRADITPATLSVSGLSASNKVYDATALATLAGTARVTPLGSDSLTLLTGSAVASFADRFVGQGKSVAVSGFGLSGADAENYSLVQPSGLRADITPATLSVSGLSASNKVYDATALATLAGTARVTPLGSDSLTLLTGSAVASFADRFVGQGKSVAVSGFGLSGADAENYSLVQPSGLRANIMPAPLAVSGVTANSKVYDTTPAATLAGTARVTPLGSDSLSLIGSGVASFSDPNAGLGKSVTVSGFGLSGADAGNYSLLQPSSLQANITPATLRYVATPIAVFHGDPVPPLSGSVLGFVGNDSVQASTTGAASFTSSLSSLTLPGTYPIVGGGLSAANYSLIQDPANATALTNAGINPAIALSLGANAATTVALQSMLTPRASTANTGQSGMVDLTQPVAQRTAAQLTTHSNGALPAQAGAFESIDVANLSQGALQGILAARDEYKKALFADAIRALERNPKLADLPLCQSPREVEIGRCLLTETLKREMQAAAATQVAMPVPAAVAAAQPTAPTIAAQPAAAPAPVPAGAIVATAPPSPPAATLTSGVAPASVQFEKRRVKTATLPQIQRKVAVVIGNDKYADKTIPQLENAVKDARAIARLLESRLGYETVVLENASKQAVVAALNSLAVELGPNDSAVIYYAGHGELIESTGLGYWQLADSDAKRPESWLSNADIGRLVAQIGASQVALISDSCYSGSLVSDQRIRATSGAADPVQLLSRKSVVVMSSGGNEPVADAGKQGHSPFAWNLMNNLGQLANWQAGGNVFERVRFAVARELPQRPKYGAYSAAGHQGGGDYLFEQRQLEAVSK